MPRPRICRRIFFQPDITYFKPAGVRMVDLQEIEITFDELEAIRLIDYENIEQEKAAKQMKISQPTLSRLLSSARKKISDSIINGKAIRIQGGVFNMVGRGLGFARRRGQGRGFGGGRGGGFTAGPGGNCICPRCGYKLKHERAIPCYKQKCPKCGSFMTRQ